MSASNQLSIPQIYTALRQAVEQAKVRTYWETK